MGQQNKKDKNTGAPAKISLIEQLNGYFEGRMQIWFYLMLGLLTLLSLLFFDPKVSIGGDDSEYLNRAYKFIKNGNFPGFQGPLYPIFIGLVMSITGLNLVIFKFCSLIFVLIQFWLFFKIFKKYLPPFLLAVVLFILAVNSSILYYASSTYTEAFFLLIQAIFIYVFDKHFLANPQSRYNLFRDFRSFLITGLMLFLMFLTKNVGLAALVAVVAFFLLRKNWLAFAYIVLIFGALQFTFAGAKKLIWDAGKVQISSQGNTLIYKHPYDKSKGKEDFAGYINRFVVNSKDYLSRHFYIFNGLKDERNRESSGLITILMYALFLAGFFIFYRKSPFWTFTAVYIGASCGVTFVALQTFWSQERLILIYIPLILAYLLYVIYYLIRNYRPQLSWLLLIICSIFLAGNTVKTVKQLPDKVDDLGHYLSGDLLHGFTPDWINYFKMSKWAVENLPEDAYVGCRKPGMAFIYSGGNEFYGIWRVPSEDPDELYNKLKEAGVTHVIMASLRVDPERKTNRTISTIRRYLTIIHSKYPDKIKLVHKIGDSEPAFLYVIE